MKEVLSLGFQEANIATLQGIHGWIKGVLSQPHSALNNLSPCPYAKEALLKNEIKIFSTESSPKESLEWMMQNFESLKKRVVVLTCSASLLTSEETTEFVSSIRTSFKGQDLWLMYDHPDISERVLDVDFSYGKEILFFIQKLTDLSQAAQLLMDKGYYKNWPADYFESVFTQREKSKP